MRIYERHPERSEGSALCWILLMLACALPSAAQTRPTQSDSAKGAAVIARHVAALGGEAAIRSVKEYHIVTTMAMPGGEGAEVRQESYVRLPNHMYIKMDMPGVGLMEMGFDGTVAWSNSAMMGPTIHPEVPKQLTDAANFSADPMQGMKIWYAGRRQIGSRTFEMVKAVAPDSTRVTGYFDVATGLQAGMDFDDAPPPPPGKMMMSFDDYKRFGGILRPTRTTMLGPGAEMVLRVVSVDHGPFDKKIFELPPAVRQLRDKSPPAR